MSLVALSIAVASFSRVSPLSYNNSRSTSKEHDSGLMNSSEALCFEYQALRVLTEIKKKVPPLSFPFLLSIVPLVSKNVILHTPLGQGTKCTNSKVRNNTKFKSKATPFTGCHGFRGGCPP